MLNVGDEAPDFQVTDHRGRNVALHDLRGRKVVLWFYPKARSAAIVAPPARRLDRRRLAGVFLLNAREQFRGGLTLRRLRGSAYDRRDSQ
jgi:hypothetical protein